VWTSWSFSAEGDQGIEESMLSDDCLSKSLHPSPIGVSTPCNTQKIVFEFEHSILAQNRVTAGRLISSFGGRLYDVIQG
jgi:hypothetical protein